MIDLEAVIHKYLSRFPMVKRVVRDVYQFVFQARGAAKSDGLPKLDLVINNAFFGFHDFCPWSHSERYLCFHKHADNSRRKIGRDTDEVTIHIYDYETGKTVNVGASSSFNWQMGARLQWLGQENKVIWNSVDAHHLVSNIFNIEDSRRSVLPRPVYAISNSGLLGGSCSFSAIEKYMPGYGYTGNFLEEINASVVEIFELRTNVVCHSISKQDVGFPLSNIGFFSHLQFSICDKLIGFFYRRPSTLNEFATDLVVYDLHSKKVLCQVSDASVITHFCWLENSEILFFGERNGLRCYYILSCFSGEISTFSPFSKFPDGHPQYSNGRIITDTYPDKRRMKGLYYLDIVVGIPSKLGEFFSPTKYKDYSRVDLHPRFSRDGSRFAVDHISKGSPSIGVGKVHET